MELHEKLLSVCRAFRIEDRFLGFETIQMGNVNKTYKVNFLREDGSEKSYLVQNVNTFAFRDPPEKPGSRALPEACAGDQTFSCCRAFSVVY